MSKILDRYASAVHSSNLTSDPKSVYSDSDVLGAAGLAAKSRPLALALTRLFMGDNHASGQIVDILGEMAWGKAHSMNVKLTRVQSWDMGKAVLAWHRDGACKPCGGHGYQIIPGTRAIGDSECPKCRGTGKIPYEKQFKHEWRELARWLLSEVEREQGRAGQAAMAMLAPRLEI